MYFAEPVPIEEVPGYAEVIKQPMDFGTIRSRVESSCYLDAESFIADMQLVTSNAMEFNPPESSYYQTAERI
ncbi:Bromodomain-containing protein, partial [Tilletiaria anomala UBC 951]